MGTACSILLSEPGIHSVRLWLRDPAQAEAIHRTRVNSRYLPGISLPVSIAVTSDPAVALRDATLVVLAVPTSFLRAILQQLRPWLPAGCVYVSVVKGVENATFLRPSEIIQDVVGPCQVVALCGPSHAEEFGRGLPTTVVAAGVQPQVTARVQSLFTTRRFRVYSNTDIIGVELAAALKNVLAIAAGISDGLGYGDNAKASLVTRGIAEMIRFGCALGACAETFNNLAGIGDLITTCFSRHGRNRRVGELLGQGASLAEAAAAISGIAEGIQTCRSIHGLAQRHHLEMPITAEVFAVLFAGKSPVEATNSLMSRPPRSESPPGTAPKSQ